MKKGPNILSSINNAIPNKNQKFINETLKVFLQSVNAENCEDFRRFLIENKITGLDCSQAENADLKYLAKAINGTEVCRLNLLFNNIDREVAESLGESLVGTQVHTLELGVNNINAEIAATLGKSLKGTQVHTLNLMFNDIGDAGAPSLGEALKGTQVQTLYLTRNNIGADGAAGLIEALKGSQVHTLDLCDDKIDNVGAARLAACIPGTLLLKVELAKTYPVLNHALETNAQKIMVTPYYLARLACNRDTRHSTISPNNELDIFMNVGTDIQGHILSLFPLMTDKMVYKYQEMAKNAPQILDNKESRYSFCTIS